MGIDSNVDLQRLNTLAVPSRAEHFLRVGTLADLDYALSWARKRAAPTHVIGGGSNVVLRAHLAGLSLQIALQGREILDANDHYVEIRVGAGEVWHDFVIWCLTQEFYGLENLALIPGTVGAAPVQNIGAYGVEVAQFIERVEGVELSSGKTFVLSARDCRFAYRDSLFKQDSKRQRVITHVVFRLRRRHLPNVEYPALRAELGDRAATAQNVFAAVCRVRAAKLPDPAQLPNCGSFFKNPIVGAAQFDRLSDLYPQMPSYEVVDASAQAFRKVAAGWLIDQVGWRGQSRFGVSVHHAQALVLTNANKCDATAVLALAQEVRDSVQQQFAVTLELEPQVMGA